MTKHRAVFLDLNGTLVLPLKQESLEELRLIRGADVAIDRLLRGGFVCPVVTIQSRIEKGLFSQEEFRAWFSDFFSHLRLDLKGPYVCPHRFAHPCRCKKPSPVLFHIAARDLSIDLGRSYAIGDSRRDVEAACRFGGTGCLVRTGWAAQEKVVREARPFAAFVGDTIADAVDWVLNRERLGAAPLGLCPT